MKRKKLYDIQTFFLLFFFLFNIKLHMIPVLTSNIVLALLGCIIFLYKISSVIQKKTLSVCVVQHIYIYIFLCTIILMALIINNSTDLFLFKSFFVNKSISILAAYFIYNYLLLKKISLNKFLKLFVFVYFFQMIIVLFFFINKDLCRLVYSYIDMGDRISTILNDVLQYRALGLSFGFDFGTADLTIALLISLYLFLTEEKKYMRWLVIFSYCAAVGILVARTMFLGIGLSFLFYVFFPNAIKSHKNEGFIVFVLFVSILLILLISIIDTTKFMRTIGWVTDIFIQMFSKKGVTSGSLYELTKGNYVFLPENRILLIGEGNFHINLVSRYTDVGFLRLIMYFGVPGLFFYIIYTYSRTRLFFTMDKSKKIKYLSIYMFAFQVLFFWKIYYEICSFPLFIMLGIYNKRNSRRINCDQYCNDNI